MLKTDLKGKIYIAFHVIKLIKLYVESEMPYATSCGI